MWLDKKGMWQVCDWTRIISGLSWKDKPKAICDLWTWRSFSLTEFSLSFISKTLYSHNVCVYRVVQLARDYATRRTAFGKLLKNHALHVQTLARMEVSLSINNTLKTLLPITLHSCLIVTCAGGDSRSIPDGHGCVSPTGPRGKRHSDPAWCKLAASAYTCGQTVHWEAGEQLFNNVVFFLCYLKAEIVIPSRYG